MYRQNNIANVLPAKGHAENLLLNMYTDIISSGDICVVLFDHELHIMYASPAAMKAAGLEDSQSVPTFVTSLLSRLGFPTAESDKEIDQLHRGQKTQCIIRGNSEEDTERECKIRTLSGGGERIYQAVISTVPRTNREEGSKDIDPLTGFYSYNAFERMSVEASRTTGQPLSILSIDINELHLINTTYGRPMGDKILLEVAQIVNAAKPPDGIVGRFNGDEFCILMPCTSKTEVLACKDKLLKEIGSSNKNGIIISACAGCATQSVDEFDTLPAFLTRLRSSMKKDKLTNKEKNKLDSILYRLASSETPFEDRLRHAERVIKTCETIVKGFCTDGTMVNAAKAVSYMIGIEGKDAQRSLSLTRSLFSSKVIVEAVAAYHENWDGTGYPHGLKKQKIPLLAQLVRVADAYATLTDDTPASPQLSEKDAIMILKAHKNKEYDPVVIEVLEREVSRSLSKRIFKKIE